MGQMDGPSCADEVRRGECGDDPEGVGAEECAEAVARVLHNRQEEDGCVEGSFQETIEGVTRTSL